MAGDRRRLDLGVVPHRVACDLNLVSIRPLVGDANSMEAPRQLEQGFDMRSLRHAGHPIRGAQRSYEEL